MIAIGNGEKCDRCEEIAIAVVSGISFDMERLCYRHLEETNRKKLEPDKKSLEDTDPGFVPPWEKEGDS